MNKKKQIERIAEIDRAMRSNELGDWKPVMDELIALCFKNIVFVTYQEERLEILQELISHLLITEPTEETFATARQMLAKLEEINE